MLIDAVAKTASAAVAFSDQLCFILVSTNLHLNSDPRIGFSLLLFLHSDITQAPLFSYNHGILYLIDLWR